MILSVDPGAERMGWALFDKNGTYLNSGIWRFPKKEGEAFQEYRLRLEKEATECFKQFFAREAVNLLVNEIVPAVGGGNFAVAGQSYLANVALACLHSVAYANNVRIIQIGATTVKVRVAGKKTASKVALRNAVIENHPELQPRKKDWTKEFDEPDAIAVFDAHHKGKK